MGKYWPEVFTIRTEGSKVRINMTSVDILPVKSRTGMVNNKLTAWLTMFKKIGKIMDWKNIAEFKTGNSDGKTTRLLLTSDVKQTRRERELEEKGNELFV